MMKIGNSVFNGLFLTGSRPLHPLVAEYLTRRGCKVSYEDGCIILDGNYNFPNQKALFAQLIELSKELYGEVNFDLDVQTTRWGTRSFEVVDKNPNKEAKISTIKVEGYDQEIIDLLFIEYLLAVNSVVYLGKNKEICYLAGDEPLDKTKLIAEATQYIKEAIDIMKIQQNPISTLEVQDDSNNDFDICEVNPEFNDLLTFKYFLENNCQIFIKGDQVFSIGGDILNGEALDKAIEEFQATEFAKLQAKGLSFAAEEIQEQQAKDVDAAPASPGIFASFSNWIWGSPQQTAENAANSAKPKPTP